MQGPPYRHSNRKECEESDDMKKRVKGRKSYKPNHVNENVGVRDTSSTRSNESTRESVDRDRDKSTSKNKENKNENKFLYWMNRTWLLIILIITIITMPLLYKLLSNSETSENFENKMKELKQKFPTQSLETWNNMLGILRKEDRTPKIIFLLCEEYKTCNDFAEGIACLIGLKVTNFEQSVEKGQDYGEVLEYYRNILRQPRALLTDLDKISASTARMFHSLCDDESQSERPAMLIFTLKDKKDTGILKPIKRMEEMLKEAWKELPENEMHPLISRIVKNIIQVISERSS